MMCHRVLHSVLELAFDLIIFICWDAVQLRVDVGSVFREDPHVFLIFFLQV